MNDDRVMGPSYNTLNDCLASQLIRENGRKLRLRRSELQDKIIQVD